jgi:hypothetical protein
VRLVSGVTSSARSIHPLVGSIHSEHGRPTGNARPLGGLTEAGQPKDEEVPAQEPEREITTKPLVAALAMEFETSRPNAAARLVESARDLRRRDSPPEVEAEAKSSVNAPMAERPSSMSSRREETTGALFKNRRDDLSVRNELSEPGARDSAAGRRVDYQPVVSKPPNVDTAVDARQSALHNRVSPAIRAGANRAPVSAAQQPEVRREPDDIEIHIGRIEVTAVPPSASPRRAVRPERKAMSLDDYLRRGDHKTR